MTHSSVTRYMLVELMTEQTLIMPTKTTITTWGEVPWKLQKSQEEFLAVRIQQLDSKVDDVAEVAQR